MMEIWYSLISVLPLKWAQADGFAFMKNALLALILVMPILGLTGTLVVEKRMAFFSDALGHGAFAGVAVGALVGMQSPKSSALIFAVVFAVLVTWISHRLRLAMDTAISVLSAFFMALGLFIASMGGRSLNNLTSFLVGDILTVMPLDIAWAFGLFVVVLLLWSIFYNPLFLGSVQRQLALSRGIRVIGLDMVFASILAAVVTLSMQWLGLLTVNACLVLPAATARLWSKNSRQYQWIAAVIALLAGVGGLMISWSLGTLVGATSVILLAAVFALSSLIWRD